MREGNAEPLGLTKYRSSPRRGRGCQTRGRRDWSPALEKDWPTAHQCEPAALELRTRTWEYPRFPTSPGGRPPALVLPHHSHVRAVVLAEACSLGWERNPCARPQRPTRHFGFILWCRGCGRGGGQQWPPAGGQPGRGSSGSGVSAGARERLHSLSWVCFRTRNHPKYPGPQPPSFAPHFLTAR